MLSIPLPKDVHQKYTKLFRDNLPYGRKYDEIAILKAAAKAYKNDPDLMGALLYTMTKKG